MEEGYTLARVQIKCMCSVHGQFTKPDLFKDDYQSEKNMWLSVREHSLERWIILWGSYPAYVFPEATVPTHSPGWIRFTLGMHHVVSDGVVYHASQPTIILDIAWPAYI